MGLFETYTWSLELPAPFDDDTVYEKTSRTDLSMHNNATGNNKKSTLHGPTLQALIRMAELEIDDDKGNPPAGVGAVGKQTDSMTIVEYPGNNDEIQVVVFTANNGKFKAACFATPESTPTVYKLKENGGHTGAALLFALIPRAKDDNEFATRFEEFKQHIESGYSDEAAAGECAHILCDNLYRRIMNADGLGSAGILTNTSGTTNNINMMTTLQIERGTYQPANVLFGEFKVLRPGTGGQAAQAVDHANFVKKYSFSSVIHTQDRLDRVIELDKDFVVSSHAVKICNHIKETTGSKKPMRNFALRGEAGVGKTEISKAVSAGVYLPYDFFSCGPNTEEGQLLGTYVPVEQAATLSRWPTLEDIQMDPGTAYHFITGKYDETISADEVYRILLEAVQSQSSGGPGFRFVESSLVQAMRYGTLIEIQEPAVILQPGVLSKLNSLLDRCASTVLDNGERVVRHPDAVMLVTTNVDYEGCTPINQSVLSRMDLIIDVDLPPIDLMMKIVAGETGFSDISMLRQMAQAIIDINHKRRSSMIKDGCAGLRELINWVQSYQLEKDILKAARDTVLATVSAKPEYRQEIENTCLATLFSAA